jgi:hypothetical protein
VKTLDFTCNCCGKPVVACPIEKIGREVQSCPTCGSTVRFRSIAHLIGLSLHGRGMPLPDWPVKKEIRGMGLSEWPGYGDGLAEKTTFINTYFHQEPLFDIVAPRADYIDAYDYLISTEVFEHVVNPVQRAFDGARKVLRKGGTFVFTVPFTNDAKTKEHFPELNAFRIVELEGEHVLINKRRDGSIETHRDLVFHGGPGTTLEMRLFCRADVIRHLEQAGFVDIKVMGDDAPEFGIIHKNQWSLPIVAKAG